jgi:hypothetical protein
MLPGGGPLARTQLAIKRTAFDQFIVERLLRLNQMLKRSVDARPPLGVQPRINAVLQRQAAGASG